MISLSWAGKNENQKKKVKMASFPSRSPACNNLALSASLVGKSQIMVRETGGTDQGNCFTFISLRDVGSVKVRNYLESGHLTGQQRARSKQIFIEGFVSFLASYLVLFLGMTRQAGIFDEGIMLTGAMRVAVGQIPHRDFYTLYGPAQFFILAGLFRSFGESILVERLFDLGIKALIVTAVYAIVSTYCRKSIAAFTALITVFWLVSLNDLTGSAVAAVSLLDLISSSLICALFVGPLSRTRLFIAGATAGLAASFRHDTGLALFAIHVCVISIAVYLRHVDFPRQLRAFAITLWPYALGFALLALAPLACYLSVAPAAPLIHDLFLYPAKYYHRARNIPFPRVHLRGPETLGIYLPIPIICVALYASLRRRFAISSDLRSTYLTSVAEQKLLGFLITFSLLAFVMYLKGFVRVSLFQMFLSILPALLLIAVLFQHRRAFTRDSRFCIICLVFLSVFSASRSAVNEAIYLRDGHYSVAESIFSLIKRTNAQTQNGWCETKSPMTRGVCFLTDGYRVQTIEYVNKHTNPGQTLYVGLPSHDRIYAADNLTYFATQRLPATKWSELDPDLETRLDVQTQMVEEFEKNQPPYIVLDSEFLISHEPNDSSKSSGVTLLDNYIRREYRNVATFGVMAIWQRR